MVIVLVGQRAKRPDLDTDVGFLAFLFVKQLSNNNKTVVVGSGFQSREKEHTWACMVIFVFFRMF